LTPRKEDIDREGKRERKKVIEWKRKRACERRGEEKGGNEDKRKRGGTEYGVKGRAGQSEREEQSSSRGAKEPTKLNNNK
jgi:hypothetical protein